ncbi:hypothetical protein AQUCO_00300147v1 [Aquilegia coerulea]|uniref:ATP-dependent DNA helicase n=1 Tax=Aquilegia coerulea TaxID=218851 RepID=A0A2G5EXF1_AQUCA|nr:hypothetical protein AQUCO_00300147v1 [Aquilegia coerulea]
MSHCFAFECRDRSLQDITDIHLPFGGKVVVLGGDFREVLPIVQHGTVAQTIKYLLRVGDGLQPCILDDMIQLPHDMLIPWKGENPLSDLILAIFPSLQDNAFDRNYVIQRAIITTTNQHADIVNDKIICSFLDYVFSHGQLYVALSRGTTKAITKFLVNGGIFEGFPEIYARNVVYREILDSYISQST